MPAPKPTPVPAPQPAAVKPGAPKPGAPKPVAPKPVAPKPVAPTAEQQQQAKEKEVIDAAKKATEKKAEMAAAAAGRAAAREATERAAAEKVQVAQAAEEEAKMLLKHKWVVWEHRNLPKGGGQDSAYHHALGYVSEFDNVEGLWRVMNNVPMPSKFFGTPQRGRIKVGGRSVEGWSMFREGVRPEWEDPCNISGAEIHVGCDKLDMCDKWWYEAVLAVVGGVLPTGSQVTGLRIIDKCKRGAKQVYRLEVWYTADADAQGIRAAFTDLLKVKNDDIKAKRHSNKPAVQNQLNQLNKQAISQDSNNKDDQEIAAPVGGTSREREARALLAKLTPERFDRLVPQLQGLLADGVVDTLDAAVQCVVQCMLQTVVFHELYAKLTAAIPSIQDGVVAGTLWHLGRRDTGTRHEAKLAASFAAALFAEGVLAQPELLEAARHFGSCDVDVEVLCTLLSKLQVTPNVLPHLANQFSLLESVRREGKLCSRLRFMVSDVLAIRQSATRSKQQKVAITA